MYKPNSKYGKISQSAHNQLIVKLMFVLVMMCTSGRTIGQTIDPAIHRADLILQCCNTVDWTNYHSDTCFLIGVYGSLAEELIPLREKCRGISVNNRKVYIKHFRRIKDISSTDVLFVNNRFNEELDEIATITETNKTLLITDRAPSDKHYMINIVLMGPERKFELSKDNITKANCSFNEKLVNIGGSTSDLKDVYVRKQRSIAEQEELVEQRRKKIEESKARLEESIRDNQESVRQNQEIADQLAKTREEVYNQKLRAGIIKDQVQQQQYFIEQNRLKLEAQEEAIVASLDSIDKSNKQIAEQDSLLTVTENDINPQKEELEKQDSTLNTQSNIIMGIAIFIGLVIFLIVLIIRTMRERKRANIALLKTNQELVQQTEEINAQTAELENVNKELEKLSIVAGKTQNAIVIMDRNGYFEWVNAGFTRFFGYTLQLLRNECDENLVNVSSNKSIRNILFKCVSNKQTIVFESDSYTRAGKKIACQTTLSPILNDKNEVTQLVAIYSDISKLMEQEAAIRSQNEELLQQKNTLEVQKVKIEEQTKSIKDGISYAQTIQQTILPPDEMIERYYDSFVLFRPKDIVSGDFYWFSEAQDGIKQYQFIGDFDCTGHGVPGAFMSLIGNRILNEVINVKKTYSPRDIMDQLNLNVIKALKQDQSTNNDGMDTCLCRVEKMSRSEYKVTFCGAKRPLYYITTSGEGVEELKGDRKSIGGTQKKRGNISFTDQELILHSGDIIVLCSDGISDQCDKDRKKFSSDRLRTILFKNRNESMKRQKELLSQELDNFRGEEEQRDDISVIGIKFR